MAYIKDGRRFRITYVEGHFVYASEESRQPKRHRLPFSILEEECLIDVEDVPTLGVILALVREARDDPQYHPYSGFDGPEMIWWVEKPSAHRQTSYGSEGQVLLAALRRS
jgi:hypothetical protein